MIPNVASSTALLSILKSKYGTCAGHTKVDATGPWGFLTWLHNEVLGSTTTFHLIELVEPN